MVHTEPENPCEATGCTGLGFTKGGLWTLRARVGSGLAGASQRPGHTHNQGLGEPGDSLSEPWVTSHKLGDLTASGGSLQWDYAWEGSLLSAAPLQGGRGSPRQ